jgi:CCR4-NOT transcriptional regulation complex NOT5 subunit
VCNEINKVGADLCMDRKERTNQVCKNLEVFTVNFTFEFPCIISQYYVKNQQDAALAVLFISNCKITLHISDAVLRLFAVMDIRGNKLVSGTFIVKFYSFAGASEQINRTGNVRINLILMRFRPPIVAVQNQ